jgi:outer membrane protein assembly factor BamA
LSGAAFVAAPVVAAEEDDAGKPEPPIVRKVEVRLLAATPDKPEEFRRLIGTREGAAYDPAQVDRDTRALYDTGRIAAVVSVTEFTPPSDVEIRFDVRPKFQVGSIRVVGNRKIPTRDLEAEIPLTSGEPLDEEWIEKIAGHLRFYCVGRGFPGAAVSYVIEHNVAANIATITFNVSEEPPGAK